MNLFTYRIPFEDDKAYIEHGVDWSFQQRGLEVSLDPARKLSKQGLSISENLQEFRASFGGNAVIVVLAEFWTRASGLTLSEYIGQVGIRIPNGALNNVTLVAQFADEHHHSKDEVIGGYVLEMIPNSQIKIERIDLVGNTKREHILEWSALFSRCKLRSSCGAATLL